MTGVVADRVKETTNTTGTGSLTLLGASSGFQSFNSGLGLNVYFYYAIEDGNGTAWEVGRGYLSGTTTLVRSFPLQGSSGANTAITLSGTTPHTVFCTIAADLIEDLNGKILATSTGMNLL